MGSSSSSDQSGFCPQLKKSGILSFKICQILLKHNPWKCFFSAIVAIPFDMSFLEELVFVSRCAQRKVKKSQKKSLFQELKKNCRLYLISLYLQIGTFAFDRSPESVLIWTAPQ
jgi:hypothetical protein